MPFLHGSSHLPDLPPFSPAALVTEWGLEPFPLLFSVLLAAGYLTGVRALGRRGDSWPLMRTLSFVVPGVGGFYLATSSGLAAYDTVLLSVHMVQHMVLSMMVPLFLALGAPVTLMLRTVTGRPRTWLLGLLHSRVARVLSFPPLTFGLFVLSPWALYFTGWYDASVRSAYVHEMMHVHLVLVGSLFFWPLVGVDPVPGRVAYPFRLLLVFLTLPFHAFLGVTIMGQQELIAGEWYRSLHGSAALDWLPDPAADQHLAGGILWGSGDVVGLVLFGVLFVQWVRSSMREARREDRRLDRLEARAETRSNLPADPPADPSGDPRARRTGADR